MKNLIKLFLFSVILLSACKKEAITNSLIPGLDPSVKLPVADTTGAFAYIEGYVDGERFAIVDKKNDFEFEDGARDLFGNDFKKEWGISYPNAGIMPYWRFQERASTGKWWQVNFNLPAYPIQRAESDFKNYKLKYTTPATFTNIGVGQDSANFDKFNFEIWRNDVFDGKPNTLGVTSRGANQAGSFIKLVSVRWVDYVPNTNYHYELIYEFDLKLYANDNKIIHLTKGRMKTWLEKIKL